MTNRAAGFTLIVAAAAVVVVYIASKTVQSRKVREPFDPGATEKKPLEKSESSAGKDEASNGEKRRGLLCEGEVVQSLSDSGQSTPPASLRATCETPAKNPHPRFFS